MYGGALRRITQVFICVFRLTDKEATIKKELLKVEESMGRDIPVRIETVFFFCKKLIRRILGVYILFNIIRTQYSKILQPVMDCFGISENYNLNIMKNDQTLTDITIGILERLEEVLVLEKPDVVYESMDTA